MNDPSQNYGNLRLMKMYWCFGVTDFLNVARVPFEIYIKLQIVKQECI